MVYYKVEYLRQMQKGIYVSGFWKVVWQILHEMRLKVFQEFRKPFQALLGKL